MRVVVVTPPGPVVTLEEVKTHLRVDSDDEDALVMALAAAATAHIDGPDGWLGRAIGVQTLDAYIDEFTVDLRLPYPPTMSITSVVYIDTAGASVTLASAAYEQRGAALVPAYGTSWPATRWQGEAVKVRYQAGYETIPPAIRAAILLMVGDLYSNRQTVETGVRAAAVSVPMSTTVEALLQPFRVYA